MKVILWWMKTKPRLYLTPGLIIDAFGELRDQQEQVKEDMEVSVPFLPRARWVRPSPCCLRHGVPRV